MSEVILRFWRHILGGSELILKVDNLSVSFGSVKALKNVSLLVKKGEFVVLIGANGAGKTTVLETILGVNRPDTGRINFQDRLISGRSADRNVRAGIALVPEGRGVFSSMSVIDNLLLGAHFNIDEAKMKLESVFDAFPILSDRKKQNAGTLSGGERQMLAIGRALMSSPNMILVDEPSIGLAPMIVNRIFEILVDLNRSGYTILLAEQNVHKALRVSDRAYILETGTVTGEGASRDLIDDPSVREAYLGG